MRLRISLVAILALLVTSGCHVLERHRPVAILVRDAETKAPITGAEVQIASASGHLPTIMAATTREDGIARVKVNPSAEIAYMVEASATGYLSEEQDVSVETLRVIAPAGSFNSAASNSPTLIVELFAGPRPTVELIVPTGFHGVLRAQIRGRDDAPYPPGQRAFTYTVPASGVVEVVGPPIFLHGLAPDIRARRVDGNPLKRDAKDDEIGLRWVRREGDDHVFFIGTRVDWADYCQSLEKYEPRSVGGQNGHNGGGGGRGGRRGAGMGMGGMGRGGMGGMGGMSGN